MTEKSRVIVIRIVAVCCLASLIDDSPVTPLIAVIFLP